MFYHTLTIDLLRHGEPVGGRKYRGAIDDPLSERGWAQMKAVAAHEQAWQAIITSPLRRCQEFAQWLASQRALPLSVEANFHEIRMGGWEGKTHAEIEAENPGILDRHALNPQANHPPDAEPLAQFVQRVGAAWEDLLSNPPASNLLVVCHAGVIRASLCYHLHVPLSAMYQIRPGNACLARFSVTQSAAGRIVRLTGLG